MGGRRRSRRPGLIDLGREMATLYRDSCGQKGRRVPRPETQHEQRCRDTNAEGLWVKGLHPDREGHRAIAWGWASGALR